VNYCFYCIKIIFINSKSIWIIDSWLNELKANNLDIIIKKKKTINEILDVINNKKFRYKFILNRSLIVLLMYFKNIKFFIND